VWDNNLDSGMECDMGLKMTTRDAVRLAAKLNLWDVETRQGGDVFRKDGAVMVVYYSLPSGRLQSAYCDSRYLPSPLKPAILERLARMSELSPLQRAVSALHHYAEYVALTDQQRAAVAADVLKLQETEGLDAPTAARELMSRVRPPDGYPGYLARYAGGLLAQAARSAADCQPSD
jgi:hypothetical protein